MSNIINKIIVTFSIVRCKLCSVAPNCFGNIGLTPFLFFLNKSPLIKVNYTSSSQLIVAKVEISYRDSSDTILFPKLIVSFASSKPATINVQLILIYNEAEIRRFEN